MYLRNVVIDDLREFDNCPLPEEVKYCRTAREAATLLDVPFLQIDNLWLDFDLGGDDTTKPFVLALIANMLEDNPEDLKWKIGNIYIITANPVGRKHLFTLLDQYFENVRCVNPLDYGLINKIPW